MQHSNSSSANSSSANQSVLDVLKGAPLFEGLALDALKRLASVFHERTFTDRQAIIEEGSPSPGLFILTLGFVHVSRAVEGAEPVFLTTLGPGALIGEAALFPELRRTASIRADGAVKAIAVSREDLLQFFSDAPDAARHVLLEMLRDVFTKLQNTTFELRSQRAVGMNQSAIDRLFS